MLGLINDTITLQWILILVFGLGFLIFAPRAKTLESFFQAANKSGKKPSFWILSSSLVISWIFAKSITNAANLGLSYGIVGGLSYACYYFSFLVAGIVLYNIRTKGGYKSIHEFLTQKFGATAMLLFSVLIFIRLYNEIWSNTMVIGSYFGESGSTPYYLSILVFTGLTLLYSLKGGMRSSLITDGIQMIFFGVLLVAILSIVLPHEANQGFQGIISSGSWDWGSGLNLMIVALIQVFSYPFHDSVMTDRAFISDPRTTLRSFLWAGLIGFVCIFLFSLIGVTAKNIGLAGQATVEIAKYSGIVLMLMINFIMITSAASTLDSAMSSFSKLTIIDLGFFKSAPLAYGRIAMVVFCILGTIPIFLDAEILSATTVSGTMVLGLAPVFLFWSKASNPISFLVTVSIGIIGGLWFSSGLGIESINFCTGAYSELLSINIIVTILVFASYFLCNFIFNKDFKTIKIE